MADRCERTTRWLKIAQISLSSITASGVIAVLFIDEYWLKLVAAAFSLLSVASSAYMKGFDPGASAQSHRDTAAAIWPIRESYLSLLADIALGDMAAEVIRSRRDELQGSLAAIYQGAPHTDGAAYLDAQRALKKNEDYTFSDEEIDKFLPKELKLVGRRGIRA
jgi:hypothetical protein